MAFLIGRSNFSKPLQLRPSPIDSCVTGDIIRCKGLCTTVRLISLRLKWFF